MAEEKTEAAPAEKWNVIIDVAECTNCNLCVLATLDEHVDNEFPGYSAPMQKHGHKWINILQNERGQAPYLDIAYVPTVCNHCDDAPCVREAKNGAVTKRPDGIVLIDPVKAKGQKELVDACPYGHIWWNEELEVPQHWNFDAHLIDGGWGKTRADQVCPTGAFKTIKLTDEAMQAKAASEDLQVLQPELNTKPRVWYRNMWRYSTAFIAGTLSAEANGVVDCVEGAKVRLLKDGAKIAEEITDNYGDFKFDRLPEESGAYTVEIEVDGLVKKRVDTNLARSLSLGEIRV
jgi:Fe-S-cluster-containing dehydrogenase component